MEKKIAKILACVDFSEYALMVLEYALELGKGAHILVYNVINQRDYTMLETVGMCGPIYPLQTPDTEEIKRQRTDRLGILKGIIKEHYFEEKARISIKIDLGNPAEMILKTIETEEIDLVVMANKGRGNIERFLFGSAAEKVFRHSPVPVVSIRGLKKFIQEK